MVPGTTTTYSYFNQDGRLATISDERKIRQSDLPQRGGRLSIAYDPADPQEFVILENERERTFEPPSMRGR